MKEFILFLHPTFAVVGVMASVWVFVEALNASDKNAQRIKIGSLTVTFFMVLTWLTSGFWYVAYYATDKALILKGPWAFAHSLVMESKEHIFFITLILSLFLPFLSYRNNIATNKQARKLILVVTALIVLSAFALEGAGAVISFAVRMSLLSSGVAQ